MKAVCAFRAAMAAALCGIVAAFPGMGQDQEDEEDVVKSLFFGDWHDYMKKGKVELVVRPEYRWLHEDWGSDQEASLNLELETFPWKHFELEFELEGVKYVNGPDDDSEIDIGALEIAAEYRLLHLIDPWLDLRLSMEFEQPLSSADDGVTDGFRKIAPGISARTRLGNLHLFGKVAYEFLDRDSGRSEEDEDVLEYQLSAFYPVKDHWRLGFELSGETNRPDGGDEHELYLTPQLRYRFGEERTFADDLELALGFPIGLTGDAADWGVFFQVYAGFDLMHGTPSSDRHNVFKSLFGHNQDRRVSSTRLANSATRTRNTTRTRK